MEFDLTDHLQPGAHGVRFAVENLRPKDAPGRFGYRRLAACRVGWEREPEPWRNRRRRRPAGTPREER